MIGGTRVFMETSGTDNTYLYMVLILAEGEIDDILSVMVDDKTVVWQAADIIHQMFVDNGSSDTNFYKDGEEHVRMNSFFGTDDQVPSPLLHLPVFGPASGNYGSGYGSLYKNSGLSNLCLRFKWNPDVFSGIPNVKVIMKGKKVVAYNSSSVAQTAAYSDNPAWCLLDYLTNERYGKGIPIANIDIPSFYTAAGICDTEVTAYGSTTIKVMSCNAVIDTSKKIIDNVRELLAGCRGYLPFSGGKYKLLIETTGTASITLTEDDIIGGYSLHSEDKNSKYNRVIVSFVNPSRNYQVDEVQFPEIDDSAYTSADQHSVMKTADGGFLLEG